MLRIRDSEERSYSVQDAFLIALFGHHPSYIREKLNFAKRASNGQLWGALDTEHQRRMREVLGDGWFETETE